jgi:hypothetical protein
MVHERKNKGKVLNYLVAIAKYLKCFTEIYWLQLQRLAISRSGTANSVPCEGWCSASKMVHSLCPHMLKWVSNLFQASSFVREWIPFMI